MWLGLATRVWAIPQHDRLAETLREVRLGVRVEVRRNDPNRSPAVAAADVNRDGLTDN